MYVWSNETAGIWEGANQSELKITNSKSSFEDFFKMFLGFSASNTSFLGEEALSLTIQE